LATNINTSSGLNNNTNATFSYGVNLNPGDLVIVQVTQVGGGAGSFDDQSNAYNLYSSNSSGLAPQSYNFYSIITSRADANTIITYTPSGTTSSISLALLIFRPDIGEKFGPPIVVTNTTGETPASTINTSIQNALAPAIMVASTNVANTSYFNYPTSTAGGSQWVPAFFSQSAGMFTAYKITTSNANQTYEPSFNSTRAFQTLLNFPVLLNVGLASAISNGRLTPLGTITGIQGYAKSNGSINLNPISQGMTSRAGVISNADVVVSLNIQSRLTINAIANLFVRSSQLIDLSLSAGAIANADLRISRVQQVLATGIGPITANADSNGVINLNPVNMSIPANRAGVGSNGSVVTQMFSTVDGLIISSTATGKTSLSERFNFQSIIIQSVNATSNANIRLSSPVFGPILLQATSNANVFTSSIMRISPIVAGTTTTGYIDPLVLSLNNINLILSLSADSSLDENITFVMSIPSAPFDGTWAGIKSNANSTIALRSPILSIINTTSNGFINPSYAQPIRSIINAMSSSDMLSSVEFMPRAFGGVNSNGTAAVIFDLPRLSTSASAGIISNASERFNFQSRPVIQLTTTSSVAERIVFNTRIINSINAISGAFSLIGQDSDIAPIPPLIATARVNANSIVSLAYPISLSLNGNSNLAERFNFQSRIIQSVNTVSNSVIVDRSVMPIRLVANIISSGYADPLINQGYTTQLEISNLIAKSGAAERFNFQSILSLSLNGDSNLSERFNFQTRIIQSVNTATNTSEKIGFILSAGVVRGFSNSNGYSDPLLAPINTISLSVNPLNAGAKSGGIENISVVRAFIIDPNLLAVSLIAETNGFIGLVHRNNVSLSSNIVANAFINPTHRLILSMQAQATSNGYSDPLFAPTFTLGTGSTATGISGLNVRLSVEFSPSSSINAGSNASDRFNFQTRIIQSINTVTNVNSSIVHRNVINSQAQASGGGYLDPLFISNNIAETRSTLATKSNANVILSTAFNPILNVNTLTNASDRFNLQSRIIQSVNSTSNGNSAVISGQPLRLWLNAQSNGYIDPTVASIQTINISAQAGAKSGGFEKLTLIGSFISEIPQVSFVDNFIQDGEFELGSSLWRGINNTLSVVPSDTFNSLQINSSFQDFDQQPAGPLGAYQTFNAVVGYKYQLSAIVKNTAGSSPRDMYVQITWANGQITKSPLTQVNSADGWINLAVSGDAQTTGLATAYIVTSTPFDNFNATDTAIIDNVSVYAIGAPATPYMTAGVRANANVVVQSTYRLSSRLSGVTNNNSIIGVISRISPLNAQAIATGYIDPLVSSFGTFNIGPINLNVKTNANSLFSVAYSPSPTINTIANGSDRFRVINNVNFIANIVTNANSLIGISYRVQPNTAFALSSGYVDPLLSTINTSNINLQLQAKSSGNERLSLVQTFSTATQVVPNTNNQLQDTSFELGSSYWFGINNYISVVSDSPYDGSYSLKTNTFNSYEEYLDGPLGAGQNFVAVGGRTYNFSAYVQNTSGATPRNMYVSIQWDGSIVSSGTAVPVSVGGGWIKLEVTAQAPTSGVARAYIITSSPFDSFGGDTSLIDNVSLTITDVLGPLPYIAIGAKSNANIRTTAPLSISSTAIATTNLNVISVARYTIPNIANVISNGFIQTTRTIPLSLTLNAISSASYPRASILQISSIQAISNAAIGLSHASRLTLGINSTSSGFAPDILPNRIIDISPLTINAKSGGQESLTLVQTVITNQPPSIPGNLVLDPEFALGSLYWSGITNSVSVTEEYTYSGLQSLLVKTTDISDPDYLLPIGIKQNFNAIGGREYLFSAYVRNISGDTRNMSLKITWNNQQTNESVLTPVSIANGWTRLELKTTAAVTGPATLYIITSNAFIPFATDIAVIDAVSLILPDVPTFTVNATIKSNGSARLSLTPSISSQLIATSNSTSTLRVIYRIPPTFINSISEADGIFNLPVNLGALQASAKVYTAEAFSLVSTFKAPDNLGDININLIANSNAFIRIRVINSIDGASVGATANTAERFNFQSRLISQATVTSLGSSDLAVTTLGNIQRLSAGVESGGDVITSAVVDLQYINASANSYTRDRFNFQSIIIQSSDSVSNGFEALRHVSRIPLTLVNAQSAGYGDISVIQPSSIRPLIGGGTSGGDITVSVDRPLEPLSVGVKSNSFARIGITFPLVPGERINLIRNGSFEQGTKFWNSISNYNTISKDIFYEGTQAILITDNDWGNSGIWQEFNAYAGANYTFSAYVRNVTGLSPRSMQLQIAWADGTVSASPLKLVGNEDGWVNLSFTTNAGRGRSGAATATIIVSSLPDALVESNAVSAVDAVVLTDESFVSEYFDNVIPTGTFLRSNSNGRINLSVNNRLTPSANIQSNAGFYQAPTPLLLNTDFEAGTAYWTGTNNFVNVTTDYVRTGSQAVILTALNTFDEFPSGPFGISQNFTSYANRKYTFSGYVKNIAGVDPRSMYAQIRWANATTSIGQIKIVSVSDDWTLVQVSGISPVTGSSTAQILTSSPFGGINGGDTAVIDSVSIVEEYIPMQFIRLTGLSAGMSSTGYVDPVITSIGTFSPSAQGSAKVNGNAVIRLISDISGTISAESTNALIRISSVMSIGSLRAQAQSVTLGNIEPFNPGLIIPQFSRGFAKVGGDIQIAVEYGIPSNVNVKVNATSNISVEYVLSELLVATSNAGGRPSLSSDPGLITQLVPYEIQVVGGMKSYGEAFTKFGGTIADFIGWGQPI
jgi:hypothetical protein